MTIPPPERSHYTAPVPPSPPPPIAARLALVVWLVLAGIFALEDQPPVKPVARALAPVRRLFGISQSWSMFAPNPPRATYWLQVEGREDAHWEALPQPGTTPLEAGFRFRYDRANKLARGLVLPSSARDRKHLAQWWCDRRPELAAVRFLHMKLPTSPPGVAPTTGPLQRTPLEMHKCR